MWECDLYRRLVVSRAWPRAMMLRKARVPSSKREWMGGKAELVGGECRG